VRSRLCRPPFRLGVKFKFLLIFKHSGWHTSKLARVANTDLELVVVLLVLVLVESSTSGSEYTASAHWQWTMVQSEFEYTMNHWHLPVKLLV
jgi:hypothetical protein